MQVDGFCEIPLGEIVKKLKEYYDMELKDCADSVVETKEFRVDLDAILQRIKGSPRKSRERSLVVTKLQEAIMWLGMDLKDMGTENPYPNSYKPENTIVDPTADGLKL